MRQERIGFQPSKVLKVYKQSHKSEYYIEIHNVVKDSDLNYKLSAGKPLTNRMMRQLISAVHLKDLGGNYFENPLLDPRIISMEPIKHRRHIIWYDPPGTKKLLFTKHMKIKSGLYSLPGMLYILHLGKMRAFAIKIGRKRPDIRTNLYYPPLFNTIGDFQFCWGSVKARSDDQVAIDTEVKMWDGYLWNSKWSHSHEKHEKALIATKKGTVRFESKILTPAGLTLGQAMDKYL